MRRVMIWLSGLAVVASGCASPLVGAVRDSAPSDRPSVEGPASCDQPAVGDDFARVDPEQVDLDADAVAEAVRYATARGATSVRVYRHDCLVATSALDASTESTALPAWSMAKGVVSIVVGRAVTLGHMQVDAPIGTYLPGLDAEHAAITVRHLLTQTSGLRFAWANDLNAAASLDSAALVLTRPFEAEPGTKFIYAQTTITALVAVLEAAVGEDFQAFASRELFEPLGISHDQWHWDRDIVGRTQGFAFLSMEPLAFARLGSLLLAEGKWRGRELIDPDYVRAGATGTTVNPAYGFLWRTNSGPGAENNPLDVPALETMSAAPSDTFWLSGMFEQNVIMVPSLDLVVVRMGLPAALFGDPMGEVQSRRPDWDHRFFRALVAGVRDVVVPDPGDWVPAPPGPPDGLEAQHLVGIGF